MNPIYQQLIDREQSRIDMLQRRIAHHKQRIETLLELAQDDEDELGAAPAQQADRPDGGIEITPSESAETASASRAERYRLPKRITTNSLKLLWFIGQGEKTLDEAVTFSESENLGMSRRDISSFANIYRNKFGLIESPALGLYRLSKIGHEFVQNRYRPVEATANDSAEDLV